MAETVDLSYQEVEELLEQIIFNRYLYEAESKIGPVLVLFSFPDGAHIFKSRWRRKQAYREALEAGLPTAEELEEKISKHAILSPEEEKRLQEIEEKIVAQHRLLQLTKIEGRRKPILELLEKLEAEAQRLKDKKKQFSFLSAEKKAEEEALLSLIWSSTRTLKGQLLWDSFEAFDSETDLVFRNSIVEGFLNFNRGIPTAKIRFLARHSLWRIRYTAALKIGGSLFERPLHDLTPDQLSLLYWSSYYQSIYEMLPDDRPDDETIENDEALDAYMEAYHKRREEERNQGRVKRGRKAGGKLSAWDRSEELIITPAHPEYMSMAYSEKRVKAEGNTSDVEVIAPNSRRARNRALARRTRQ